MNQEQNHKGRSMNQRGLTSIQIICSIVLVIHMDFLRAETEELPEHSCPLEDEKLVAMTFDDGPSPRTTIKILEILKEHDAKATFFVVGQNALKNQSLMQEIVKQGHEVGNHSFSHVQLTRVSIGRVKNEIASTSKIIHESTGSAPVWFRPPYGSINKKIENVAEELGLKTILWTDDPRDWSRKATAVSIENKVMGNLKSGSVVLLHDNHSATIEALPVMLKKIKERGYKLVTVNELKLDEQKIIYAKSNVCGKAAS